jgi:hypothetical protein
MAKRSVTPLTEDRQLWEPLPPDDVRLAFVKYLDRRPGSIRRTIQLQLHNPGWRKTQNLLWARKHFNNYIFTILETLREDPHQFRDDGAFECIHEMMVRREETRRQGKPPGKYTRVLGEVIAERFRRPARSGPNNQDTNDETVADNASDRRNHPSRRRPPLRILEARDYPIIHMLRPGAQRRCALILLNFYIQSQKIPQAHEQAPDSQSDEASQNTASNRELEHAHDASHSTAAADFSDEEAAEREETLEAEMEALETDSIPTIEMMHQMWAQRWMRYEAAASTRIPYGQHRGKPFGEALAARRMRTGRERGRLVRKPGKRRVRWLKERTYALEQVHTCLRAVQILLHRDTYGNDSAEVLEAEQVRHLWKYESRTLRRPRARRVEHYRSRQSQPLATLGSLSQEELHTFRDELYEQLDHAHQYAQIAEAVDIFLEHAPPSYPTIDIGLFNDSPERREHHSALNWFPRPVTRGSIRDSDDDIERRPGPSVDELLHRAEYDAVTRLLQAESELGERALQPLTYTRTMRPPAPLPCWALLYKRSCPSHEEREQCARRLPKRMRQRYKDTALNSTDGYVYTFVLAMVVHHTTHAFTGEQPADYFSPSLSEDEYFYVNFPLTPFHPPQGVSLMMFPLECGEEYQEGLLHDLIERLRAEQHAQYAHQFTDPDVDPADRVPVEACLPTQAALGEAKIVTRQNGDDWYEFFLHCAVPIDILVREPPERILGLHHHQHGYSWALIDAVGTLINAGDLQIPWHVRLRPGSSAYSDNYAFEVANQIVALAQEQNALICIENTWTNKKATTSAHQNQRAFAHPSRKIYDQVVSKAIEAGLPRPRAVYGISRSRCGACGNRINNQRGKETLSACPACGSLSRSAHIQFPLASLAPTADGSTAAWVLLAQEQEHGERAAALTDFFYWTLRQAAADVVPAPDRRQAFIAGLEQVQWQGRQVFRPKSGRNTYTRNNQQAGTNSAPSYTFRPRRLEADVVIAGPEAYAPRVQQWIAAYELVAPDVLIEYVSMLREHALDILYGGREDAVADVILLDTPASERELAAGLAQQRSWFCQDCGQHWQVDELRFRCTYEPCRHHDLARYNTAAVVAQIAVHKLLEGSQQERQHATPGTTGGEHETLA